MCGVGDGRSNIGVMWRSKSSRCETVLSQRIIPARTWTHIAVVFKPADKDAKQEYFGFGL